jgi:tRNA(adenine34) deaminase
VGQPTVGSNPTASAMNDSQQPGRPGAPDDRPTSAVVADDEAAMRLALKVAVQAPAGGDVPVGAVALAGGHVVASRHNEREATGDPTAHAEVLALRDAARSLGSWRLDAVTLVVTLEPCAMCAGALVAARLQRLVFGATDPKAGACGSLFNLTCDPRLNHEVVMSGGVLAEECGRLLSSFFAERRDPAPRRNR